MTTARRDTAPGEGPMRGATWTHIAGNVWRVDLDRVSMFVGQCDDSCHWTLANEYRRPYRWIAQHGNDPEAALVFDPSEPFDAVGIHAAIEDWLDRCHDYVEGQGMLRLDASTPGAGTVGT